MSRQLDVVATSFLTTDAATARCCRDPLVFAADVATA